MAEVENGVAVWGEINEAPLRDALNGRVLMVRSCCVRPAADFKVEAGELSSLGLVR